MCQLLTHGLQETPESKLPPADYDLGHQIIESQQFAVSQPGEGGRQKPSRLLFAACRLEDAIQAVAVGRCCWVVDGLALACCSLNTSPSVACRQGPLPPRMVSVVAQSYVDCE